MFSWKRQRKEQESPRGAEGSTAMAMDCVPLGTSPVAVVDPSAFLPNDSTCSSETEDECAEARPLPSGSSGRSIELAALPVNMPQLAAAAAAASLQQQQQQQQQRVSTVRAKAAYFEALIRCNTTTHVQCSLDGPAQCTSYPDGAAAALQHPPASPTCTGDPTSSSSSSSGGPMLLLPHPHTEQGSAGAAEQAGEAADWAEFSEVHMVLRVPRVHAPPGGGKYGSATEMEALIEQLQGALEVSERQRKAAVSAFKRRSGECENLMRVVRELTESRKKAVLQRASLTERYAELQSEYARSLRIADLSRTVSKENLARTSRTRTELRQVQSELHATKSHAQQITEKHKKVRVENLLLKEKVTLLERFDFEEMQESECKKHYTRYRLTETY